MEERSGGRQVTRDIYQIYLSELAARAPLSPDEEARCGARIARAQRCLSDALLRRDFIRARLAADYQRVRAGRMPLSELVAGVRIRRADGSHEVQPLDVAGTQRIALRLLCGLAPETSGFTPPVRDASSAPGRPGWRDLVLTGAALQRVLRHTRAGQGTERAQGSTQVTPADDCASTAHGWRVEVLTRVLERLQRHLVDSNLRLVHALARRYRKSGLPMLDLIQEGNLGLLRAAERFDPARGCRFSTYAYWWIQRAMLLALNRQRSLVRPSIEIAHMLTLARRADAVLTRRLGRAPRDAELAQYLGCATLRVAELRAAAAPTVAVLPGDDDEDGVAQSSLIDAEGADPCDAAVAEDLRRRLHALLVELPPRHATIVCMRFGIDGVEAHTLEGIGRSLNLTRERVRQLERKALNGVRAQPGWAALEREWKSPAASDRNHRRRVRGPLAARS